MGNDLSACSTMEVSSSCSLAERDPRSVGRDSLHFRTSPEVPEPAPVLQEKTYCPGGNVDTAIPISVRETYRAQEPEGPAPPMWDHRADAAGYVPVQSS
jgi:hypothetical protein